MSPWLPPHRLMFCLLCPANQWPRIISLFIIQFLIIKGGLNPMWYTANPDYDITRLICYFIPYLYSDERLLYLKNTPQKNPFWKHSSRMNMFPFTVSDNNKRVIKSVCEVWTMKCECTVAQSGRESSVQMESNQLVFVLQIQISDPVTEFHF